MALTSLVDKTAKNVSYVGVSQLTALALNTGTLLVLARVLTPDDFGVVAVGVIFMNLLYNLQNFGILQAIVQRDTRVDEAISVGLTLRWVLGIVLVLIMVALSGLIGTFFGDSRVSLVSIVLSLNLLILPFGFTSQVLLTRSLRFSRLALAAIAQAVSTAAVTLLAAALGYGYWSIVFGSLAGSVAFVIALRVCERSRVKPVFNLPLMKDLLSFGKHLLVTGIMSFVVLNVDQMIIGNVLGVTILGLYYVATKFGRQFGRQVAEAVNQVLFPTMARIKDDIEKLRKGYISALRMICVATAPLCLGFASVSSVFVTVFLGPVWSDAVIPMAILSIQGFLSSLVPTASNVLFSVGKPQYLSAAGTAHAIAMVVGIYPVTHAFGLEGVCVYVVILSMAVLAFYLVVLTKVLSAHLRDLVAPLSAPLISASAMCMSVFAVSLVLPHNILTFAALVGLGLAVYVPLLHKLSHGRDPWDFISLIRSVLKIGKKKNEGESLAG